MSVIQSCRRKLLIQLLDKYKDEISGDVLDVGGVKINSKLGIEFESFSNVKSYKTVNINKITQPDILLDANNIKTLSDHSFDTIICTELIEYINEPIQFTHQCIDLLKPHGVLHLTVPLHHSIHGDSILDKWRITKSGLISILNQKQNISYEILPMGGFTCVIYDFIHANRFFNIQNPSIFNKTFYKLLRMFQGCIIRLDSWLTKNTSNSITTGYYVKVNKHGK